MLILLFCISLPHLVIDRTWRFLSQYNSSSQVTSLLPVHVPLSASPSPHGPQAYVLTLNPGVWPPPSSLLLSLTNVPPCIQYCCLKCLQPAVILTHLRLKSHLSPSPGNSIYKTRLSLFLFPQLGMNFCNFIIAFIDSIHSPLHSTLHPATRDEAGQVSQCWPLDFYPVSGLIGL